MPLAAMHHHPVAKGLEHRRSNPLLPSMTTSRPWEISSPRSNNERRNGVSTCSFSVSGLGLIRFCRHLRKGG